MRLHHQPKSLRAPRVSLRHCRSCGRACSSVSTPRAATSMGSHPQEKTMLQRLGQSFNSAGVALFAKVALRDRPLALPHLSVADIRWIDWSRLRAAGFEGCVFDKDNTLTEPYQLEVHPHARDSLARCMAAFNGRLVLYSNSAGLKQFDPDGAEAAALEAALGVPVLRHTEKKPAGGPDDMERHFGCSAEKLIMVGDRFLTDIVFGNRNRMLTIRPAPFTSKGEPKAVWAARAIEQYFVDRWRGQGVKPPPHPLVPDPDRLSGFLRHPDEW